MYIYGTQYSYTGPEFEIQGPHILGCLCHNQNPGKPRSQGQYIHIYIHLYTIYIYLHTYAYSVHIYTHIRTDMHICIHNHACAYTHVCIHTNIDDVYFGESNDSGHGSAQGLSKVHGLQKVHGTVQGLPGWDEVTPLGVVCVSAVVLGREYSWGSLRDDLSKLKKQSQFFNFEDHWIDRFGGIRNGQTQWIAVTCVDFLKHWSLWKWLQV